MQNLPNAVQAAIDAFGTGGLSGALNAFADNLGYTGAQVKLKLLAMKAEFFDFVDGVTRALQLLSLPLNLLFGTINTIAGTELRISTPADTKKQLDDVNAALAEQKKVVEELGTIYNENTRKTRATGAESARWTDIARSLGSTIEVTTSSVNGLGGSVKKTGDSIKTATDKLKEYSDALSLGTQAQRDFDKSQKQTGSARTSLATANTDLAKAQENLNRAVAGYGADSVEAKRAQSDLEKAQRGVERAGYRVEESVFAVTDAEKELANVRLDPESTPQAIREAEINLAEAKLATKDAIDSQTQATNDLATSQSTLNELVNGAIEGSDFYAQFSDALSDAKDRQKEAEERLTDAILAEAAAQERLNDANEKADELAKKYPKIAATVNQPSAIGGDAGIGGGVYGEVAAVAAGLITQDQADELMIRRGIVPFADGGLVKNPMLGLVGEAGPELIIPLSKLGNMGNNINITVNAGLGASGVEVGREIEQYLREYSGFTGRNLQFGSVGAL
jgi:hypothetical protein